MLPHDGYFRCRCSKGYGPDTTKRNCVPVLQHNMVNPVRMKRKNARQVSLVELPLLVSARNLQTRFSTPHWTLVSWVFEKIVAQAWGTDGVWGRLVSKMPSVRCYTITNQSNSGYRKDFWDYQKTQGAFCICAPAPRQTQKGNALGVSKWDALKNFHVMPMPSSLASMGPANVSRGLRKSL